ncbi:MAG: 7-cyano-7-deazaguanine synthase QueC [Candidatus Marinimicrobia bacterium]|jgi:7-cyano-7-deazaguanine synthase|nr:7-cyano-7-deazaguanine synthase QueC [Candidatus Neomarinimicrobiota bacterium]MBT3501616.1 7-cyano-7-deazaguanine synthase QueC [Candidatus Neomarinimicrobiota bacterium]MBT3838326.1 7-cyano-7-deazaguanine synthase QueC [Candidatus Neomarinimicrobiota bacterium]MBT4000132.1 7-cyano-7-deazaguanine synthase QueC [Candidatus Neomarinimicrobiota bacterium]MBT4281680.1 7-cyano-7-deazaguanine synthase QueC [Candidatus Neomarinimicrobiota bacterium]
MNKKAVILLSGGLDSTTCLSIAKKQNYDLYALTVNYGQRHVFELDAAKKVSQSIGVVKHSIVNIDLGQFGGSALTDDIDVPKDRDDSNMTDIPITYVPARNTVLLSMALAWAETLGATDIFIGVNSLDYSGYPDCRPEFIEAFERTANLATKAGVEGNIFKIHTPLINLTKAGIIKRGIELGIDYGITTSCYDPHKKGISCGHCDACILRLKGFKEAGLEDPVRYK